MTQTEQDKIHVQYKQVLHVISVQHCRAGSKGLQADAFRTAKALFEAIGDSATLAFFLPGVVSKCFVQLHAASDGVSNSGVTAAALALTSTALLTVLSDDALPESVLADDVATQDAHSAKDVLAALHALSITRGVSNNTHLPQAIDTPADAAALPPHQGAVISTSEVFLAEV